MTSSNKNNNTQEQKKLFIRFDQINPHMGEKATI